MKQSYGGTVHRGCSTYHQVICLLMSSWWTSPDQSSMRLVQDRGRKPTLYYIPVALPEESSWKCFQAYKWSNFSRALNVWLQEVDHPLFTKTTVLGSQQWQSGWREWKRMRSSTYSWVINPLLGALKWVGHHRHFERLIGLFKSSFYKSGSGSTKLGRALRVSPWHGSIVKPSTS